MSTNVVLVATYELGHQSFGLASAAASLRAAGATVTVQDLSIHALDEGPLRDAGFVGIHVPMHTATRLAEPLIRRLKAEHPAIYICAFGLYAAMNKVHLRQLGADVALSGEFEQGLVDVFDSVASGLPPAQTGTISLQRLRLEVPNRSGLPPLASYAHLRMPNGDSLVAGYTEATRGCKHLCRHCPIVPVYRGRFVIVEPEIVLADIRQQVDAGARHITFGDPDFLNGPIHALRIVRRLHEEFPELTYDVTIKVEHLRRYAEVLPELHATGCILVTSAIESFDEATLQRFDKRHTTEDLIAVLSTMDEIGIAINPTFVTFTPWTTVDTFIDFLETIVRLGLVRNMSPVQYAIRLLVPAGSRLLELPEMAALLDPFDESLLCYPWSHPDPTVDRLFDRVTAIAAADLAPDNSRAEIFTQIWHVAHEALNPSATPPPPPDLGILPAAAIPYLTEPWYC